MDHKAAVERIVEIEQRFDVESLYYMDYRVWPLIRFALWFQLVFGRVDVSRDPSLWDSNKSLSVRLSQFTKSSLRTIKAVSEAVRYQPFQKKQMEYFHQADDVDIVLFSLAEEHSDRIHGRFYNRYVDPMIEIVRRKYSCLKIELDSPRALATLPRFEHTTFLNPTYELYKNVLLGSIHRQRQAQRIRRFDELKEAVLVATKDIKLSETFVIRQADRLARHAAFFEKIMKSLRPKTVFIADGASVIPMALVLACKRLGITTAEIQHGQQGRYNGKYSHWTRIPPEGFELLPDFYWAWGEESKQNMLKWYPSGSNHPQPVVGGNLWLGKWLKTDGFGMDGKAGTLRFLQQLKHTPKVILVTLQPIADILPRHVLDAIRRSPEGWLWLIRLHPSQRELIGRIGETLKQDDRCNFEVEHATQCPLYAILKQCDHHVTCWSSVCYEALVFNVPTTIVHPIGLQLFEEHIDRGLFSYAENGDALLREMKGGSPKGGPGLTEYIETGKRRADEALGIIMSRGQANGQQ